MNLQQQVQQHLQNTGISLRELSRRSGVSHTTIGKILRGGTYKSDTAHALYSLISITPISTYKTLDATVEQLAAQCIDADLTHVRDPDLECAKYRRVMQLEQQLNDANTAYLSSKSQHDRDLQRLNDANTEIKRLTALSEMHGQSWKAACVQAEQLQKQLDQISTKKDFFLVRMDAKLDQALETSQKNAASAFESALNRDALQSRFDTLFVERENAATLHDQQVIRLRVRCFALVCAIVLLIVSGLVVWGGV